MTKKGSSENLVGIEGILKNRQSENFSERCSEIGGIASLA